MTAFLSVFATSRIRFVAFLILAIALCLPVLAEPTVVESDDPAREVVDSRGVGVRIRTDPTRVVSLSPSMTEVLFAVGAGDAVKGVTTYCNYPEEVIGIDTIGGFSGKTISIEAIVALEPDVVFADMSRHGDVITALEGYGIPVVATEAKSVEQVYQVIELAGEATGNQSSALAVTDAMKARIDAVAALTSVLPQESRPRVFWEVFDEPLMTAGPSTFIGQLVELAGGANVFADTTESWPRISQEVLLSRNPEVMMSSDSHGEKFTPDVIAARSGWQELDAVRNGRIHLFDGDMVSRPGPRIADVLEAIAASLHPDLF